MRAIFFQDFFSLAIKNICSCSGGAYRGNCYFTTMPENELISIVESNRKIGLGSPSHAPP